MRFSLFRRTKRDDLSCQRAVELVGDYLDGGLAEPMRLRLERHLARCPHCTEYVAQLRITISGSAQAKPEPLTETTRQDLIALYRRTISDQ